MENWAVTLGVRSRSIPGVRDCSLKGPIFLDTAEDSTLIIQHGIRFELCCCQEHSIIDLDHPGSPDHRRLTWWGT